MTFLAPTCLDIVKFGDKHIVPASLQTETWIDEKGLTPNLEVQVISLFCLQHEWDHLPG